MTTTMQRWCRYVSCSILAAAAYVGAARGDAPPSGGGALSQERSGQPPAGKPASDERGLKVVSAPLRLKIGLQLRGPRIDPRVVGTLVDGDTIVSGDRIRVSIETSEDAHLYLAFCNARRELVLHPSHGSIGTHAGQLTSAPGERSDLLVDDNVGTEVLYVILSRAELSSADPRVSDALKASLPGGTAAACREGHTFSKATAPAPPPRTTRPDATARPQRPAPGAGSPMRSVPVAPPLVTIERGMQVSQDSALAEVTADADANGIAILRYRFKHVATAPAAAPAPAAVPAPAQQP